MITLRETIAFITVLAWIPIVGVLLVLQCRLLYLQRTCEVSLTQSTHTANPLPA